MPFLNQLLVPFCYYWFNSKDGGSVTQLLINLKKPCPPIPSLLSICNHSLPFGQLSKQRLEYASAYRFFFYYPFSKLKERAFSGTSPHQMFKGYAPRQSPYFFDRNTDEIRNAIIRAQKAIAWYDTWWPSFIVENNVTGKRKKYHLILNSNPGRAHFISLSMLYLAESTTLVSFKGYAQ